MTSASLAERALAAIEATGVVAILRGDFLGEADALTDALLEGGVRVVEVPFHSAATTSLYRRMVVRGGSDLVSGFGTVTTQDQLSLAIDEGAAFIVAPNTDPDIVARAVAAGLLVMPGAFTPSEIVAATRAGAQAVKLFPADVLGERFVRGVRGPLPDVRLVPTGGVTVDLARAFRAAGAWAVGVGGPLVGSAGGSVDAAAVARQARAFVDVMRPRIA
ncbi:MAG: bifunctional 4-hydroxy-2-oxoglutarate aldolase/2-dehydro-3-deoxy-phosphogluconate aldolase [Vicinamibacteria bacterium]